MGEADRVWPLLKHSADPRLRSFIVNWLSPLGADPRLVVAELELIDPEIKPTAAEGQPKTDAVLFHPETSMRRALILALGTYGTEGLSAADREPLSVKLLDLYRNDPDAGIHGASEWTLRQWDQREKLKAAAAELSKLGERGDRRWFVNRQGQSFAIIEGPVEFRMGSPPTEPDRIAGNELSHRRTIPGRYALAAKEVTVEQFQGFLKESPKVRHSYTERFSPDTDGAQVAVTWYEAAAYCDWLNLKEGLPACYELNERGEYAEGMRIKAGALKLEGYRLPTEAEWEYACRAGAMTSRYYGESEDLLGCYAQYPGKSRGRAWSCGSLQPNDLGLFDSLGNVYEWVQDRPTVYPVNSQKLVQNRSNSSVMIMESDSRLLRGGSFASHPACVRSAYRYGNQPSVRDFDYGFRPARSYP
jgi:formylglycine-generating enzyme required for sulfatase activity